MKDKELMMFLNEETDKKKTRMQSIYSRAQHSEENKNVCNGKVFTVRSYYFSCSFGSCF